MSTRGAVLVGAIALASCGDSSSGGGGVAPPRDATMAEGVVARVGQLAVTGASVARIAQSQKVELAAARDIAIRDALFASEAQARGLERDPEVLRAVDRVLARRLLHELQAEAHRKGPPTDAEVAEVTERHWLDLDRPEGFVTIHAVALFGEKPDAETRKLAEEAAESIRQRIGPISALARTTRPPEFPQNTGPQAEDPILAPFRELVNELPKSKVKIQIDALPPIAVDGRGVTNPPSAFDPTFASAASRLMARGDVSPPTTSPFGVHIIVLTDRVPELRLPLEERRKLVTDEVMGDRARTAQRALLDAARRAPAAVVVDRSADALLALVDPQR